MTGRTPLTLSGTHASFFVLDGLQSGQSYVIDVSAVNAAGAGPAAETRPATPR